MKINKSFANRKPDVQAYFRNRASEIISDLASEYGKKRYKKITQELQPAIRNSRETLIQTLIQASQRENWNKDILLSSILLIHHVSNATMLEFRHKIWPYEYMTFSRRIGELWESFVRTCFIYPVADDLELEIPPLFADVRNMLAKELLDYINSLPLKKSQKKELKEYYSKVWLLVDAGEIKLELDMHCKKGREHFNIDFKSGFSSNEKGNTNRLLVVASIYTNIIEKTFRNLILVRSTEEESNHYLQTLKRSSLWEVYCGDESYSKISNLVDFNLSTVLGYMKTLTGN
jgi:hypothetical protein